MKTQIYIWDCSNQLKSDEKWNDRVSFLRDSLYTYIQKKHKIHDTLKHDKNGKPYLSSNSFHISISHKRPYIMIGISEYPIGIDIEIVKSLPPNVIHHFFTEEEQNHILNNKDKTDAFYEIWTKKEAYLKFSNIQDMRLFSVINNLSCVFYSYPIDGYKCYVCTESYQPIQYITLEDLSIQ